MSNILQTESLTKSRHFLRESLRILWTHKGVFFAFATGPILLFMSLTYIEEAYHLQSNGSGGTLFINILFDIAWLRYILHEGPTKSLSFHWIFDKSTRWVFPKFSLYYLLIFLSYGASIFLLYYLCQLPMEDFMLLLDPQFTRNVIMFILSIIMFILSICVISYFLLPAFLALSAISINQPVHIFKVLKEASPYRMNLFLGCLTLAFTALFLFIFLSYCANFAMITDPSMHFIIESFLMNVWAFSSAGVFFNLFSLYYKKHLAHPHEINI